MSETSGVSTEISPLIGSQCVTRPLMTALLSGRLAVRLQRISTGLHRVRKTLPARSRGASRPNTKGWHPAACVVAIHIAVIEPARGTDLVLGFLQLFLQLKDVFRRSHIWMMFRVAKEGAQPRGQVAFGPFDVFQAALPDRNRLLPYFQKTVEDMVFLTDGGGGPRSPAREQGHAAA